MAKKMTKKIICNTLAVLSATACLGLATACETAHPEVEMTITFNGNDYVLEYELYRNVAPSTVEHFLWLADNNYYDGLCVHNYDASALKMYTGAYTASDAAEDETGLLYKDYFTEVQKFENFPTSAWKDLEQTTPLYTLAGEFEANGFTVENGAKKQSFGSLTMYYTEKTTKAKAYIPYRNEDKEGEVATREYKYNSTTSQFYISLSTAEAINSKYCTFATLTEDSVEKLQELQAAINSYIEENYVEEEDATAISQFTTKQTVTVDNTDPMLDDKGKTVNYLVPNQPIIIKEVKVKKF